MRFLLIAIALFATGCWTDSGLPLSGDPGAEGCAENSPPFIANVEMDSEPLDNGEGWQLALHWDWADPGVGGASDPPNMEGGYFNGEAVGFEVRSLFFTEAILVNSCMTYVEEGSPIDPEADLCDGVPFGRAGCTPNSLDTCTQGEITRLFAFETPLQQYQDIVMEFRVRDRCGAASNEKFIEYEIGSGHLSENPDESDE